MRSFPFDSLYVTMGADGFPEYDRSYNASDLRDVFSAFFENGVVKAYGQEFHTYVDLTQEVMTVTVGSGCCHINGATGFEDAATTLQLEPASPEDRIDSVVARLDTSIDAREITLEIVSGTPSSNPVHPPLTRAGSVWEIGLADIHVAANATVITDDDITSTVTELGRCGYVGASTPTENIVGVLPVAKGGTGNTTAQAERNRLGLGNTTGALPVANGGTGVTSLVGNTGLIHAMFDNNITNAGYVPVFTTGFADGGYMTVQNLRNAMGLGNTTTAMTDFVVAQYSISPIWFVKFASGIAIVGGIVTAASAAASHRMTGNFPFSFTKNPAFGVSVAVTAQPNAYMAYCNANTTGFECYVNGRLTSSGSVNTSVRYIAMGPYK